MLDPLLTEDELSKITGRAVSSIQKDRTTGTGCAIPFVKIGRLVRYRRSDVEAYLAALPAHKTTSEISAARDRSRWGDRPKSPVAG